MNPEIGSEWIPTERTHWVTYIQVFSSVPLLAVALILLWFDVLVPEFGVWPAILTVLAASVACGFTVSLAWGLFRPAAIRVSPTGISIRRFMLAPFEIPKAGLKLSARSPKGFGIVSSPRAPFVVLSPNQFAAARQLFRLTEPSRRSGPPQLS